ncbi:MAG: M15 family metallopeptidase [Lachnospiraceae bacterium]|nr:M15 family metallopeptidase [Lachnospiraceae bacterium]
MLGVSFPVEPNRDISMEELRYVRVLHYDFAGEIQEGELVVNQKIAWQTMRAFYQLYKIEYPIEKVRLVDDYEADDELSMEENNSSAFNYRRVEGKEELSKHALGLAIDINPLINPYVRENEYFPANATEYLERDVEKCTGPHKEKMIHKGDLAYRIFRRNGFEWGGEWSHAKDYQHFVAKRVK